MGMYTEIIFGAALKLDIPEIKTIKKLVDGIEFDGTEPDHLFFKSSRPWLLTSGGSYYFPGNIHPKFWKDEISELWYLHFRTSIKNYNDEIEKFLDWIKPYIVQGSGINDFYAIVTYEDDSQPTIYYLNKST
jgi:hypothetical protein